MVAVLLLGRLHGWHREDVPTPTRSARLGHSTVESQSESQVLDREPREPWELPELEPWA